MDFSRPDAYDWPPPEAIVATDEWSDDPESPSNEPDDPPLDRENWRPRGLAEWFAISQTLLPALLFLPGSQAYRLPLRVGAYAISLYAFVVWWLDRGGKSTHHPTQRWLSLISAWLLLMLAHPMTTSLVAGLAQVGLYFSIYCPVFWVPAYVQRRRQLVRVLALLLVCNGINSMVGVLQVYDPERWMPRELSVVYRDNPAALEAATYTGPNGQRVTRPPGLFDTPGAVCAAGTVAALLGLVFALEPLAWWKRGVSLGMAGAGISAIYLSHVRASFVVALGMMATYLFMLTVQNQRKRVAGFAGLAVGLILVGLSFATVLGGSLVQERFASLLEGDPRTTYYQSRGQQVEYAMTELVSTYPLGAGLARWGMMKGYFGTSGNYFDVESLWAETQPNAWILDGGVLLLILYVVALLVTSEYAFRLVRTLRADEDRLWSAAVAAVNIGTLALVFTFIPFGTYLGMQYWFLEGALHGAMKDRLRRT